MPLYVWVIAAVLVAIPVGLFWGDGGIGDSYLPKVILRRAALAAPLVVLAILSAIVTNDIRRARAVS